MLHKETKLHSGHPSSQLSVHESFKTTAFPGPFTGFRMPGVCGAWDWRKEAPGWAMWTIYMMEKETKALQ